MPKRVRRNRIDLADEMLHGRQYTTAPRRAVATHESQVSRSLLGGITMEPLPEESLDDTPLQAEVEPRKTKRAAPGTATRRKAKKIDPATGRVLEKRDYFSDKHPQVLKSVSQADFVAELNAAIKSVGSVSALAKQIKVYWRLIYDWQIGRGPTRARMDTLLPTLQAIANGISIDKMDS